MSVLGNRLDPTATPEPLAEIRAAFGLNRPAHLRYADWLVSAPALDVRYSWVRWVSIWQIIEPRLYDSLLLAAPAARQTTGNQSSRMASPCLRPIPG